MTSPNLQLIHHARSHIAASDGQYPGRPSPSLVDIACVVVDALTFGFFHLYETAQEGRAHAREQQSIIQHEAAISDARKVMATQPTEGDKRQIEVELSAGEIMVLTEEPLYGEDFKFKATIDGIDVTNGFRRHEVTSIDGFKQYLVDRYGLQRLTAFDRENTK